VVAYPVVGIAITLDQTIITAQIPGIRMFAYDALEIQDSKMAKPVQIRTLLVYYKPNKGLIRVLNFSCLYPPTGNSFKMGL